MKLSRVLALCTRKRKWRLREQEDPEAYIWYDDAQGADNENQKELAEAVKEQLEASVVKGQAMKLTAREVRRLTGDGFPRSTGQDWSERNG